MITEEALWKLLRGLRLRGIQVPRLPLSMCPDCKASERMAGHSRCLPCHDENKRRQRERAKAKREAAAAAKEAAE